MVRSWRSALAVGRGVTEYSRNLPDPALTGGAKRISIAPTCDSREAGPRYHVTYRLNDRALEWQGASMTRSPVKLHVGWPDLLHATLSCDPQVVEDVFELDGNYLGTNCTSRDAFNAAVLTGCGF